MTWFERLLPLVIVPVGLVFLAVALASTEWLVPARRTEPSTTWEARFQRVTGHLTLAACNLLGGQVIMLGLVIAGRSAIGAQWFHAPARPLLVDLLLLDLWTYACHRVVHAWPLAWRFHQVHHQDERLDVSTALRFHPGDVPLFAGSRALVALASAMPLNHLALFEAMVLAAALLQHANVRLPPRLDWMLGLIIVTPAQHWAHHQPARALHDSSFGTVLSIWDHLSLLRHGPAG
jgi:sterol desaturase/sphingolipid hydroxylase (fatty acid hydroxylase superfamily)